MISMIIPRPQFFLEAWKIYQWEGSKPSVLGSPYSLPALQFNLISGQEELEHFWPTKVWHVYQTSEVGRILIFKENQEFYIS